MITLNSIILDYQSLHHKYSKHLGKAIVLNTTAVFLHQVCYVHVILLIIDLCNSPRNYFSRKLGIRLFHHTLQQGVHELHQGPIIEIQIGKSNGSTPTIKTLDEKADYA